MGRRKRESLLLIHASHRKCQRGPLPEPFHEASHGRYYRSAQDHGVSPQEAPEDDKSAFLAQAGYTIENSARLLADIREQILPQEAESLGQFAYGIKFRIRSVLRGPSGVALRIVSIWTTLEATGETRFITLYPN